MVILVKYPLLCLVSIVALYLWFLSAMRKVLREMFTDKGVFSFGRIGAAIALHVSIIWVSWVVYKTNAIPDLSGISLFISSLYLISKGLSVAQSYRSQTNAIKPGDLTE